MFMRSDWNHPPKRSRSLSNPGVFQQSNNTFTQVYEDMTGNGPTSDDINPFSETTPGPSENAQPIELLIAH